MKRYLLISFLAAITLAINASAQTFEDGRRAANDGDFRLAFQLWYPLAEKGDAHANFAIGKMFARGDGVPKDFERARHFFEAAALKELPEAKLYLGRLYEFGDGVSQDFDMARRWYSEAAEAGNAEASSRMAALPPDPEVLANAGQEPSGDENFFDPDQPFGGRPITKSSTAVSENRSAPAQLPRVTHTDSYKSDRDTVSAQASDPSSANSRSAADWRSDLPLDDKAVFVMVAVFGVLSIVVVNGIRLGLTDKMIFYDSGWDLMATLLIWLLPVALSFPIFVASAENMQTHGAHFTDSRQMLIFLPIAIGFILMAWTFVKSLKHNGFSFGAICVAISKITISFLVLFYWGKMNDRKSGLRVRLNALFLLTLLAGLMACLVNGERVREERLATA